MKRDALSAAMISGRAVTWPRSSCGGPLPFHALRVNDTVEKNISYQLESGAYFTIL